MSDDRQRVEGIKMRVLASLVATLALVAGCAAAEPASTASTPIPSISAAIPSAVYETPSCDASSYTTALKRLGYSKSSQTYSTADEWEREGFPTIVLSPYVGIGGCLGFAYATQGKDQINVQIDEKRFTHFQCHPLKQGLAVDQILEEMSKQLAVLKTPGTRLEKTQSRSLYRLPPSGSILSCYASSF